jgi:beta-glucanase (GH16 family)
MGALFRCSLVFVTALASASAWAAPPTNQNWRKIFQDNFDGSRLDATKWSTGYPYGNLDGHNAYMSPDHVKVRAGHLILTGSNYRHPDAPDTFTPDENTYTIDYTSGAIHNRGKVSLGYGYVEARMKMPSMKGAWPAFWLLRNDNDWPPEIDVVEAPVTRDFDLRKYHYTYHYGPSKNDRDSVGGALVRGPNFSEGFHTFGTAWTESYIEWYLDDRLVERIEGDFFDMATDLSMILNLGIGGWAGKPPADAAWDAKLRVDWVRAYKLEPAAPSGGRMSPVPEPHSVTTLAALLLFVSAARRARVNASTPAARAGTSDPPP